MLMMREHRLPWGKTTTDGRLISIDAVMRGLACDCVCPECERPLVAAKGDILRHHFRHYSAEGNCYSARETALHLFAKQVICDTLELGYPRWFDICETNEILGLNGPGVWSHRFSVDLGQLKSARAEVNLDDIGIRADVVAEFEHEPRVVIEIFVAHRVDEQKLEKLAAAKIPAIEIDLSYHRWAEKDDAAWQQAVLHQAHRYWLFPPSSVQAEEKILREQWIEEQRRKTEMALAIQRKLEEDRLAEERSLAQFQSLLAEENRKKEQRKAERAQAEQLRAQEIEQREQLKAMLEQARAREREAIRKFNEEQDRLERAAERAKFAAISRSLQQQQERAQAVPSLDALVHAHGGYSNITLDAWAEFDTAVAMWKERQLMVYRREEPGAAYDPLRAFPFDADNLPTDHCEVCDAPAHFGYRGYQGDGGLTWFCAAHRLAQWWADARQ